MAHSIIVKKVVNYLTECRSLVFYAELVGKHGARWSDGWENRWKYGKNTVKRTDRQTDHGGTKC